MAVSAEILLDSYCQDELGQVFRLTTFKLKMPKLIVAQFNTHGSIRRNSASARAVPIQKIIQRVIDDPVIPMKWGTNKPGMQAGDEPDEATIAQGLKEWLQARDN